MEHIIAGLAAMFNNIWKMIYQFVMRDGSQIFPHKISTVFLHLFVNFLCKQIPWKQFIYKTVHILIIKSGTFTSYRFRNKKASFFFIVRVKSSRMDLDIIQIFQFNIMTSGNLHAVTGQVFEISGMLVCSTNTAGCKYYIVSLDRFFPAIRPPDNSTITLVAIAKDI